jgi:hypothetical protein
MTTLPSLLTRSILLLLSTWLLSLMAGPTVAQTRAAKAPPAVVDQLPAGRVRRGADDSGAAMTSIPCRSLSRLRRDSRSTASGRS